MGDDRRMLRIAFLLLLSLPVAADTIAIRSARLLDVKRGALVADAVVIIDGERITAAGARLPIPEGARVIELPGMTLLPGLIDAHTHLLASTEEDGKYETMLLMKSQAYRALEGAANAKRTLLAGFTTVRDVENEGAGYADVALRDAIDRALVDGPRMQVATRGIAMIGQYMPFGISPDLPEFPRGAQMISGVEEARRAVREQLGNGADLIKVYADWTYPTLTPDELRAIVEEAHKAGRRVAAHATTVDAIRNAIDAGVDSIEHGDGADRATLELMKQKGVWLVPTFAALLAQLEKVPDEHRKGLSDYIARKREMLRTAREVGVKVAIGYDPSGPHAHGRNAREIVALSSAGFTNGELLRAATIGGAELLAWQERVGSLESGKLADIIAVAGDPLADLTLLERVAFVMKGGAVVRDAR
jgi:imidazolonepropionase-like amidohydrolase